MFTFRADSMTQRSIKVYAFTVSAEQLLSISKIERFGDSSDGVNRKFNESHAIEIAEAMLNEDTVMLDSICGDLKGPWSYERGRLIAHEGAYLSIDDGQHRFGAVGILNPEERKRWTFPVVATMGLPYETRLKVFRQQRMRKPIDSRLDLAMRHTLDDWKTDAERQAYELVLKLNSNPASPLKGMIILDETISRPYEHQHRTEGINAAGLWTSLKTVMSRKSPLYALSREKRAEVALNQIFLASEVWDKAWMSEKHVLTTARGINSVLMLIVSGKSFRVKIGDDFRHESLRDALSLASKFNWTSKALLNHSNREITAKIDELIGRSHQRMLVSGSSEIIA